VIHHKTKHSTGGKSVAVLLLLIFILASCGGTDGGESGGASEQSETTQAASEVGQYILPGATVYPEGVAYQPGTGNFFVGSTTDGTVFRGNVENGGETEVSLEPGSDGRETAVGMKVDEMGRLYIAGGDTGRIFVYDATSSNLIRALETPNADMTFINDVAVAPDGSAYFTDSMRPVLFRVSASDGEVGDVESWLDLEGTAVEYGEGFNLNGIAATEDGRYLITVQSNTGKLFRIDTQSKEVVEIDLGGETLENGDGILLDGQTLYVVRNRQALIFPVELSEDFASGEVGEGFTDPSLAYPTAIAKHDDRLLVVNSQFDRRQSGEDPELPFTVSEIEIP
jgi:Cu-Zn family superoxide dismutase